MLKVGMQRVEKWLCARRAIEKGLFPFECVQRSARPLIGSPEGVAFDVLAFDVLGHRFARFHPVCQAHQKPHWILIFSVVRVLAFKVHDQLQVQGQPDD